MGTLSRSNWNLEMLVFEERGKPENPEKNLPEQGREPTTNSTHMMLGLGIEPGPHWWEVSALKSTIPDPPNDINNWCFFHKHSARN